MDRQELERFVLELLTKLTTEELGSLNRLLPHYSLEHNVKASAVRILKELGYDIINIGDINPYFIVIKA